MIKKIDAEIVALVNRKEIVFNDFQFSCDDNTSTMMYGARLLLFDIIGVLKSNYFKLDDLYINEVVATTLIDKDGKIDVSIESKPILSLYEVNFDMRKIRQLTYKYTYRQYAKYSNLFAAIQSNQNNTFLKFQKSYLYDTMSREEMIDVVVKKSRDCVDILYGNGLIGFYNINMKQLARFFTEILQEIK